MAEELALLRSTNVEYIFQDHFVETSATYFHELVAAARAVGLEFLAESDHTTTHVESFPQSIREVLAKIDDPVRAEQYADFVFHRRFRATLLCRRESTPKHAIDAAVVAASSIS